MSLAAILNVLLFVLGVWDEQTAGIFSQYKLKSVLSWGASSPSPAEMRALAASSVSVFPEQDWDAVASEAHVPRTWKVLSDKVGVGHADDHLPSPATLSV